ncbi:MAG: ABC transporter permease [Deltaproteobacteria bacterium]|nr:ABC transporter permease [Deltaproteobacteria bacterium]MBW1962914.1 ABC transporter permease [Deltaproteobacteria bacterium]MBW1993869.1 ABC transporter permease [Deltaproteobacteria bacterium]MBW2150129.1 ABC transporter permease [Deltaproteobacteria bacterium]
MRICLRKRLKPPSWNPCITTSLSVFAALCLGAVLFLWVQVNPITAYFEILKGAFGSLYNFSEVLVRASPLILCGLSVALAGNMQIWNIGAEGQLVMGGVAGAGLALFFTSYLPQTLIIPLMILAGFMGGALWGLIPGILRARLQVNEIISSLMLNYVAILWLEHLYFGPWRDPAGRGFPGTAMFEEAAWFPRFFGTRIHLGLPIGLVAAATIWFLLSYAHWGYQIRVAGASPGAARYAQINIARNIIWVMFLSGGLAGLAGICETAGIHYRLQQGLAVGNGYMGIVMAWLGKLRPGYIVLISILLGGLMVGGDQVQITLRVPSAIGLVLQGAILFCVLGAQVFQEYELHIQKG